ncbi:MAG: DUF4080 domain-containing protein [Erysipelotrichaceae bacterium]
MKVLLVSVNSKFIHSSLGIWYLYSSYKDIKPKLDNEGTNIIVDIYESTINTLYSDTIKSIVEQAPDVIGFSTYIWNIEYILKIASSLKKILNCKIFLGGMEASYNYNNLLMNNDYIDFIARNEGEEVFKSLLLNEFNNLNNINNIAYVSNGEVVTTPLLTCSASYVNPYSDKYFECLNGRIAYIETTRGCPFSCAFCLSGRHDNVHFFDLDIAKDNILRLANSGCKTVKFIDRTFNCNEKRSLELMKYILDLHNQGMIPSDITFHAEIGADLFQHESLEFFKTLPQGLFQFEAGLQSFNVKTLEAINRKTNVDKLVSNLLAIKACNNIHLHIDLIAGLPYENYESFKEGFNLAYKLDAGVIQLGFLKLLRGSTLESQKDLYDYKYLDYAPYQILSNKFISYNELVKLEIVEDCVDHLINSSKYRTSFKYMLKESKLTCFDLLYKFGCYHETFKQKSVSQETYAKQVYDFCLKELKLEQMKIRDLLCYDKMCSDQFGRVYAFLHIEDKLLSKIKAYLKYNTLDDIDYKEALKQGKLGLFIAYSSNKVIIINYLNYNKANEVYEAKEYDKDYIENITSKEKR